ncbi:MAG: CPBP family intramembrane metalloprotease [Clostridiales bacterium]|nr:CPBP family intramembrane metalloprotease [Clostridiales bacterium]
MTNVKDKKIRHFFLIPFAVVFAILLVEAITFELFVEPFVYDGKVSSDVLFLVQYGKSIFSWLFIFIYCLILERPLLKSFWHMKQGGLSGNTIKNLLFGMGIGLAMNGLCALAAFLHGDLTLSFAGFSPVYQIVGLIVVFIQSGGEELLMRGYFMGAIQSRYGTVWGLILNAALFAALHGSNKGITVLAVIRLLCVSVVYGLLVTKYKSLWMAMGIHTTWNYTQSLLLGLPNSGIASEKALLHLDASRGSIFYNDVFGLEGGITGFLVFVVLLAIILLAPIQGKSTVSSK